MYCQLDTKRLFDIFAISGAKTVKKQFQEGTLKILYSWIVISWSHPLNVCSAVSAGTLHRPSNGCAGAISAGTYDLTETCRLSLSRLN